MNSELTPEFTNSELSNSVDSLESLLKAGKIRSPKVVDLLTGESLQKVVVSVDRVQKTVKSGKFPSYRVIVAVGDGKNLFGVGLGKHVERYYAVLKATLNAKKNLLWLPLGCGCIKCDENCEVLHSIKETTTAKISSARVQLKPAPAGTGIVNTSEVVQNVLGLTGIKDCYIVFKGSKNKLKSTDSFMNRVKAIYEALKVYSKNILKNE